MKINRYILISIHHVYFCMLVFYNAYSWPGIPYPFRGPSGEIIMGLGLIGDMEPTPDGNYFVIKGDSGRKIYMFNIITGIIEKIYDCGSNYHILEFSPDQTKLIAKHNQNIDLLSRKKSFQIFDYKEGVLHLLYTYNHVSVSPYPFSPDSTQVVFYKDNAILLNIETGEETQLPTEIPASPFFSSDGKQIAGIERIENSSDTVLDYDKKIRIKFWDVESGRIVKSFLLENISDWSVGGYKKSRLVEIRPLKNNYLIALVENMSEMLPGISGWDIDSIQIYLINSETGQYINSFEMPSRPSWSFNYKYSPQKRWIACFTSIHEYASIVNLDYIFRNNGNNAIEYYEYGPYPGWIAGSFDYNSDRLYFIKQFGRIGTHDSMGYLDLKKNKIIEENETFLQAFDVAAISPVESLILIDNFYEIELWDYQQCLFRQDIISPASKTRNEALQYRKDGKFVLWCHENQVSVLDTSSWECVGTVNSASNDQRTHASFSNDFSVFLTASGKRKNEVGDNLIRIWDAKTFEMLREFRGHPDNVWYAEFSPDDRRIVSASLDGTAKVWDVASGNIVADFTIHNASVEYAAFFPDGERVLSIGKDRRALIWNVETTQIEKTLENLHFPAKLSPDGRHLFAGSEVWDIESGRIIKTLDDFAQDYACLTLSPDGTQLLTSEEKGLTKIWNVPEHILKPSGIEHFQIYEGKEEK